MTALSEERLIRYGKEKVIPNTEKKYGTRTSRALKDRQEVVIEYFQNSQKNMFFKLNIKGFSYL